MGFYFYENHFGGYASWCTVKMWSLHKWPFTWVAYGDGTQFCHAGDAYSYATHVVPPFPTLAPVAQESLEILTPIQLRMPSFLHLGIEHNQFGQRAPEATTAVLLANCCRKSYCSRSVSWQEWVVMVLCFHSDHC